MTMIGDVIGRMSKRTDEISTEAFDAQMSAWQPESDPTSLEYSSLVARNSGQVGRLIEDAKQRRDDITAVINKAIALRSEIETSLAAWEAAQAVLAAPLAALADKIKEAAAETGASAGEAVKTAAKVKRSLAQPGHELSNTRPMTDAELEASGG